MNDIMEIIITGIVFAMAINYLADNKEKETNSSKKRTKSSQRKRAAKKRKKEKSSRADDGDDADCLLMVCLGFLFGLFF